MDVVELQPVGVVVAEEVHEGHHLRVVAAVEAAVEGCDVDEEVGVGSSIEIIAVHDTPESLDYLNSIHVDYRGLIPKGLALEAPEGMYKN